MEVFNQVWTSPETLPTKDEIASPQSWLERVDGGAHDRRAHGDGTHRDGTHGDGVDDSGAAAS